MSGNFMQSIQNGENVHFYNVTMETDEGGRNGKGFNVTMEMIVGGGSHGEHLSMSFFTTEFCILVLQGW